MNIENKLTDFQNYFFIGVAGTGMSAIAQYLAGSGFSIAGSDRYFLLEESQDTKSKLEAAGIRCYMQDSSGIAHTTQCIVISTAIEDNNVEIQKARSLNIPIITRSQLLARICDTKKTIAIGGTSGKSTTCAMLFDILHYAGLEPSIISGAGLTRIIQQGKIGNAWVGQGDWLVIEADESDGSIVNYHASIGVLLNVDKDHKELSELESIFAQFKHNTQDRFIVNQSHPLAARFSQDRASDFSSDASDAGYQATDFVQEGFQISFHINQVPFHMHSIGKHNMENALAAVSVAHQIGVALETCASALAQYDGIYRRNQIIGEKEGIWLIDDYAHNPAKVAAAIASCQNLSTRVIAWFQPHGYGPTKFLRADFVQEIAQSLRTDDEIWMSEIYYAGGTAIKDISASDLVQDIRDRGKKAFFIADRNICITEMLSNKKSGDVILLMGARDPSLDAFAHEVYEKM